MANSPKLFGFDIRRPGVVAGGAQSYTAASAPFRPRAPRAPWVTFDKYVNPSVFLHEDNLAQDALHSDRIVIRSGTNAGFDLFFLWDDAADMIANYPHSTAAGDAAFAYSWCDLSAEGAQPLVDDTFEVLTGREISPSTLQNTDALIGFDIVSPYFISALAGYDHAESEQRYVEMISEFINPVGLIAADVPESMLASLVRATEIEIAEDPFFAVGLYLLWDHSGQISRACGMFPT